MTDLPVRSQIPCQASVQLLKHPDHTGSESLVRVRRWMVIEPCCQESRLRCHVHKGESPPEGLIERLAAESVYVAPRLGRLRISPHVYNDEQDVDRFAAAFREVMQA